MRLGRPQKAGVGAADLARCIADAVSMLRETGPLKRANVVVEVPPGATSWGSTRHRSSRSCST